jgi:hypothetical protein
MTDRWPSDDEALFRALEDAVRAARDAPPGLGEAAKAAFAWHTVDDDLAALAYDSAGARGVLPNLREDLAELRNLTFVARDLTVELEISARGLIGQIIPPAAGRLEVQAVRGGHTSAPIDALGCFFVSPLTAEAFRLHMCTADGVRVLTGWIKLGDEAPSS